MKDDSYTSDKISSVEYKIKRDGVAGDFNNLNYFYYYGGDCNIENIQAGDIIYLRQKGRDDAWGKYFASVSVSVELPNKPEFSEINILGNNGEKPDYYNDYGDDYIQIYQPQNSDIEFSFENNFASSFECYSLAGQDSQSLCFIPLRKNTESSPYFYARKKAKDTEGEDEGSFASEILTFDVPSAE